VIITGEVDMGEGTIGTVIAKEGCVTLANSGSCPGNFRVECDEEAVTIFPTTGRLGAKGQPDSKLAVSPGGVGICRSPTLEEHLWGYPLVSKRSGGWFALIVFMIHYGGICSLYLP